MNETEYLIQIQQTLNLARLVIPLKIHDALQAITHVDTLGPTMDPTLWQKAHKSLYIQKRVVQAALQFQLAIQEIAANPTVHLPKEQKHDPNDKA